jgi:hypothetical protein
LVGPFDNRISVWYIAGGKGIQAVPARYHFDKISVGKCPKRRDRLVTARLLKPKPQPTAVATTSSRPPAGDLEMTPGRPFAKGVSGVISVSAAAEPVSLQAALRPARRDSQKS